MLVVIKDFQVFKGLSSLSFVLCCCLKKIRVRCFLLTDFFKLVRIYHGAMLYHQKNIFA